MAQRLEVVISGDSSQLSRALNNAVDDTGKFSRAVEKAINVGAFVVMAAAGYELGKAVKTLAEKATLLAETNAIIESTGEAAGVTSEHIVEMADSLEKLSLADDTEIQKGENLLLTFKNIQNRVGDGNDIYDQATKAMLDMSQVMGKDVATTAIQVGKALNDPILGVGALRKAGVQLSEQQKQQVEDFMAVGDVMSAQKVILAELTSEFGGAAQAAQDSKPWDLMKDNLDDMAEGLMIKVMPSLVTLTNFLNANLQPALRGTAAATMPLMGAFVGLKVGALAAALGLASSASSLGLVGAAIGVVVAEVFLLWTYWEQLKTAVMNSAWFQAAAGWLAMYALAFNPILLVATVVIGIIKEFGGTVASVGGAVAGAVGSWAASFSSAFGMISGAIYATASAVSGAVGSIISAVSSIPGAVWGALSGLYAGAYNFGASIGQGVVDGVNAMIGSVTSAVSNLASSARDAITSAPGNIAGALGIPGYASGTNYYPGGLAVVGERGPELVTLPRGSRITPNNQLGSAAVTFAPGAIQINGATNPEATADAVYRRIMSKLERNVRLN